MPQLKVVSFSGGDSVELCFDFNQEAQDFLNKYQRIEDLIRHDKPTAHSSWQSNPTDKNSNIGLPLINWPEPPPLRINALYWPTGASRFAYGLFLATGEQVRKIKALACIENSDQPIRLDAQTDYENHENDLLGEKKRFVTFTMYALTPRRINGCREEYDYDPDGIIEVSKEGDEDLYIVPLVDERYWWQFKSAPAPCGYETWANLIDYLATSLGISLESYAVDSDYDIHGPHASSWARYYHNAAQLIDAACASVGSRFVAKYDAAYTIERHADAEAVLTENFSFLKNRQEQIAGFECDLVNTKSLPESINVLFPKASCGILCSSCTGAGCVENYYKITKNATSYLTGKKLNERCLSTGSAKNFHVRGYADMNCSCAIGTPSNYSDLNAIANQIAADWYGYNSVEYDFTITGPFDWEPCGYDDHILHTFGVEYDSEQKANAFVEPHGNQENAYDAVVILEQERRRDYQTRVQSWPQSVGVDCLLIDTGVGERTSQYGMATAVDCILPGNTGSATLAAQGGAGTCTITIDNTDCLIFALPGDIFPVVYMDDCASDCKWKPAGQFGTTRWARVWNTQPGTSGNALSCDGAMGCCSTRTAYVLEDAADSSSSSGGEYGTEHCTMQETACEITVYNTTNRKIASDKDYEDVLVTLIPGKTCLWYIHDRQRPQRAKAQLIVALCGNLETRVVNFEYLDVCGWQQPEEPLEVHNPYGLYACAAKWVELAWNEQACLWEIVQVPDEALPLPMLDILCHPDLDTCTIQKEVPRNPSYGHSCYCDDATENKDTQVTGEKFDIFYNVEDGEDSTGTSVLTGADCGSGCSLEFTAASIAYTPKTFKRKRVCLYCPKDTEGDAATINSVSVGSGTSVTITGNEVDVVTGIEATWTGVDSSSGDDCPTSLGTINLTFKTKTVCVFCSDDGGGLSDGLDVDFPLEIKSVEGLTEADFTCDPCPGLSVKTTMFYALCVATEGSADVSSCTCVDCTSSSS